MRAVLAWRRSGVVMGVVMGVVTGVEAWAALAAATDTTEGAALTDIETLLDR
jgi:hypothetical protein